jgi:hypothetical protein
LGIIGVLPEENRMFFWSWFEVLEACNMADVDDMAVACHNDRGASMSGALTDWDHTFGSTGIVRVPADPFWADHEVRDILVFLQGLRDTLRRLADGSNISTTMVHFGTARGDYPLVRLRLISDLWSIYCHISG